MPDQTPVPPKPEAEEVAKKLMANLQMIEAQYLQNERLKGQTFYGRQSFYQKYLKRSAPPEMGVQPTLPNLQMAVKFEKNEVLYEELQRLQNPASPDVKNFKEADLKEVNLFEQMENAFLDTVNQMHNRTVGFDTVKETWQNNLVHLQNVAQTQYDQVVVNKAAEAFSGIPEMKSVVDNAVKDVAPVIAEVRNSVATAEEKTSAFEYADKLFKLATLKEQNLPATASPADKTAAQEAVAHAQTARDQAKDEVDAAVINAANFKNAAKDTVANAVNAIAQFSRLAQEIVTIQQQVTRANEAKPPLEAKVVDALMTRLADKVTEAKNAGMPDNAIANIKANPAIGAALADAQSQVTALQQERDKTLTELKTLESTDVNSKFYQELESIARATESHREMNHQRMRENSLVDFGDFDLIHATEMTEEERIKASETMKDDPAFKVSGEDQSKDLKSGFYKKKGALDGDPMVYYDAKTHHAHPVPGAGRATGYAWLDGGFRRAMGDTFDRLAKNFNTISLTINPDFANLPSLKVMVDLVIERKRFVKLDDKCLQLVAYMSSKDAEAFLRKIEEHNKSLPDKHYAEYQAVKKADAAAPLKEQADLLQKNDVALKQVPALVEDLKIKGAPTADDINHVVDAVTEFANNTHRLADNIERNVTKMENDHPVKSTQEAHDKISDMVADLKNSGHLDADQTQKLDKVMQGMDSVQKKVTIAEKEIELQADASPRRKA